MKFAKPVAFLAVLLVAACQGESTPSLTVERLRGGLAQGIDLPSDASDVLNELKGSRLDFVARYYRDPASRWPPLSAIEVQRLSSLGLTIVAIWESHSHNPLYFSYASGYSDAWNAYRQAKIVGQPAGSAIYFAVDFNANAIELPQVEQYFRGTAAGFAAVSRGRNEYKVGVYGSGAVCDAMKRAGLARYSWLSNSRAWAGSSSYVGWNIRQGPRIATLSFGHDSNEAKDEYGGFRVGSHGIAAASTGIPPRDVAGPQAAQPDNWLTATIRPGF